MISLALVLLELSGLLAGLLRQGGLIVVDLLGLSLLGAVFDRFDVHDGSRSFGQRVGAGERHL